MARYKLDKLIKQLQDARAKALTTSPVRLSTLHKQYTTTKTLADQEMQRINRINRNAPIRTYKVEPEA